ncbi:C40 family peptidase [Nocardioides convexus]|uniref:C40 family peptidase n=1 Tax=Nocardioides convexus TaxID=2712224 RepID=UPI0024185BAC|nr:C40 family peptidase [Nocardioides convexus]
MSIDVVTARIGQIQAQLAQFATTAATATSGTAFSEALSAAGTTTTSSGTAGQAVVEEAKKYLGLPYVWGGTSKEKGVDCSGLVQSVYKTLGYDLPRLSADQARSGTPVKSLAEAQPGDLIAWDNSSRNNGADHIAIYIGDGKMIEAPRTGLKVRIVDVPSEPDMIRRIIPRLRVAHLGNRRHRGDLRTGLRLHAVRRPDQRRRRPHGRPRRVCSPRSPSRSPASTREQSARPVRRG